MFYDEALSNGMSCAQQCLAPRGPVNMFAKYILLLILVANVFMFLYLFFNISSLLRKNRHIAKDLHGTVMKLSVITGIFLFCTTPYIVTQILQVHIGCQYLETSYVISMCLWIGNSAVNPILYVWRFKEARYQLNMLFCLWNEEKLYEIKQERNKTFATYAITHM
jgi:hypothetical protein